MTKPLRMKKYWKKMDQSVSLAIASDTLLAEKGNYYSLRQQNNFLLLFIRTAYHDSEI